MKFPLWIEKRVKMTVTRESPGFLSLLQAFHISTHKYFSFAWGIFHTSQQNFPISREQARGKTFLLCYNYFIFIYYFDVHIQHVEYSVSVLWKWKNFSERLVWFFFHKKIFFVAFESNFNRKNVFTTKSSTGGASLIMWKKRIKINHLYWNFFILFFCLILVEVIIN